MLDGSSASQKELAELDGNSNSIKTKLQQILTSQKLRDKIKELRSFPVGKSGGKYSKAQIVAVRLLSHLRWEGATEEQLSKLLADTIELMSHDDDAEIKNSLDVLIQKFCKFDKTSNCPDNTLVALKGLGVTIDNFDRGLPISMPDNIKETLKQRFEKIQPVSPVKNNLKKLALQLGTLKTKLKNLQGKLTLLRGKL